MLDMATNNPPCLPHKPLSRFPAMFICKIAQQIIA